MFQRRMPDWLRHSPTPNVRSFAILAGFEAAARGVLISTFPIVMYRTMGDAETVSEIYFAIGIVSLATGLLVPWLTRFIARRWMFTIGAVSMITGSLLASTGGKIMVPMGLALNTAAVVIMFVCFNAYVMDHVKRTTMGALETQRLFYSGISWTVGPALGVTLLEIYPPAPFLLSSVLATCILAAFWYLRLSDGRQIMRARAPSANPLAYLPRFFAQPRLVAGWLFAVTRSVGWWVYIVYLPIFAVENGFDEKVGGTLLSISNGFLFLTPLMLKWMNGRSVRSAIRTGFAMSALCFSLASLLSSIPVAVIGLLLSATFFLILLDLSAGLPFLMAVRPGERTEMSAVYATYRDVSGIIAPGVGRLVLAFAPLPAVFAAMGLGLGLAWIIAAKLHPRLGRARKTALQ